MNRFGKIAGGFACGLVLNAGLSLSFGALSSNPYEPIVTRNIFDLNPPQVNAAPVVEPPAKITLDGIMNIFGSRQALFYVDIPPRPPEPAMQKSYILSEGQQQDDIEVTRIDENKGVVTFNNHGVVQEIPLVKAAPITTPTPVVMSSGAPPAAVAFRGFRAPGGENATRFDNRLGQNNAGNAGGNWSGNAPGGNYGNTGFGNAGSTTGGQNGRQLSPEEQMIMIAAQHAQAQQAGDPIAKIFPPTPLDEAAGVVPNNGSSSTPPTP
jgi:hypothetical protein